MERMDQSDIELWRRAGQGDGDAFVLLFRRHADAIYNFCFRRTADWAHAEDLTSRTFLEAWRRRADVEAFGDSLLPWLYGVAANVVRTDWRTLRRRVQAYARRPLDAETPDFADDVAARLDSEAAMRRILEAARDLGAIDRDVLTLSWQGLTYTEIAFALGLPLGTVRSRLSRARSRVLLAIRKAEQDTNADSGLAAAIGDNDGHV